MEKHRETGGGREQPKAEVKMRAHQEHVETRCTLFLNGWKTSDKNLVEEECSETEVRTRRFFSRIRDNHAKRNGIGIWKTTLIILASRRTEIAYCAGEPKITWALCWRRTSNAILGADKFGDLITADY